MRQANTSGSGELIWPKGCSSVEDVPWDLLAAISHAHSVLQWQANLSGEEMPPRWMWQFGDLIEQWIDDVVYARKNGHDFNREDKIDGPSMENEYASRFKK